MQDENLNEDEHDDNGDSKLRMAVRFVIALLLIILFGVAVTSIAYWILF